MTLRDYFAAQALAGQLAYHDYNVERAAKEAYRYADEMLKQREEKL
jgi:hypothetical protein